jgi:DNA oxidative demethylase
MRDARGKHTRRHAVRRAALHHRRPSRRPRPTIPPSVGVNAPLPAAQIDLLTTHIPNWMPSADRHKLLSLWSDTQARSHTTWVPSITHGTYAASRTVTLTRDPPNPTRDPGTHDTFAGGLPIWAIDVSQAALRGARGFDHPTALPPNFALLSYLGPGARLSMKDVAELFDGPIVSIAIGAECRFRLHDTQSRGPAYTERHFCSGDLLVFSTDSSTICLGRGHVRRGPNLPFTGLTAGRLSLTLGAARAPAPRTCA